MIEDDLSKEEFWNALQCPLPPPYSLIEERAKENILKHIAELEKLDPDGYDYSGRYSNSEVLEYYRIQLETYRIIRPEEVEAKEKHDTIKDMANILRNFPK